jgi:hypothetical protein
MAMDGAEYASWLLTNNGMMIALTITSSIP